MRGIYIAASVAGLLAAVGGIAWLHSRRNADPGQNAADVPPSQTGKAAFTSRFGVAMRGVVAGVETATAGKPGSSYTMNAPPTPIASAPPSMRQVSPLESEHPVTTPAAVAAAMISPTRTNFPT